MSNFYLSALTTRMETSLRQICNDAYEKGQAMPELSDILMAMAAADSLSSGMKKDYLKLKMGFETSNQTIGLTEDEYNKLIDDLTSKVLYELIEPLEEDKYVSGQAILLNIKTIGEEGVRKIQSEFQQTSSHGEFEIFLFHAFFVWRFYLERDLIDTSSDVGNKKLILLYRYSRTKGI